MTLIDKLESKLGRFAIPGLIQAFAIFQLIALACVTFLPPESGTAYIALLNLNPDAILNGEVWRIVTHVLIPTRQILWAIIGAMFLVWLGRGLETAWGAFRVNLYVFGTLISYSIGALIFGYGGNPILFQLSLMLAFASIYPNEEVHLYFILPVKIKWIAIAFLVLTFLPALNRPFLIIPVTFGLLPFLIAFGPDFIKGRFHAAKVSQRRERYQANSISQEEAFHHCKVCGKTEHDDRTLEFRVTADGDEICSSCRNSNATS